MGITAARAIRRRAPDPSVLRRGAEVRPSPTRCSTRKAGTYRPISHRDARRARAARRARPARSSACAPAIASRSCRRTGPSGRSPTTRASRSALTDVPIYPNLPAEQIAYILSDSGAVAIFVSTAAQAAKIAEIRGELPALKHVIAFDDDAAGRRPDARRARGARRDGRRRRARTRRYRDARARGEAGRSRDDHLHVGHDGRAEGRDAHARQHLLERRWRRRAAIPFAGDDVVPQLPAAVAHLRADGRPLPDVRTRARRSRTPSRSTRCRST